MWAKGNITGVIDANRNIGGYDDETIALFDTTRYPVIFAGGNIDADIYARNTSQQPNGGRIGTIAAHGDIDGLFKAESAIDAVLAIKDDHLDAVAEIEAEVHDAVAETRAENSLANSATKTELAQVLESAKSQRLDALARDAAEQSREFDAIRAIAVKKREHLEAEYSAVRKMRAAAYDHAVKPVFYSLISKALSL